VNVTLKVPQPNRERPRTRPRHAGLGIKRIYKREVGEVGDFGKEHGAQCARKQKGRDVPPLCTAGENALGAAGFNFGKYRFEGVCGFKQQSTLVVRHRRFEDRVRPITAHAGRE